MITIAFLGTLTLADKLALAGWIASGIIYLLSNIHKLPKPARAWLQKIGKPQIEEFIKEAEKIADMPGVGKRLYVADKINEITHGAIPKPISNLIIEFVFNQIQHKLGK